MKIIYIFDAFERNTTNEFLLEEVLFLRKQDIDTRIITLTDVPEKNSLYSESFFTKENFRTMSFGSIFGSLGWKNLKAHLEKEKPDMVITCGKKSDIAGRVIAKVLHTRKVFVFAHNKDEMRGRNKLTDFILSFITDKYIVVSEGAKKQLSSLGVPGSKIVVLRDGIPFEKYGIIPSHDIRRTMEIPPEEFVFVMLGSLLPEKGVDVLLRALSRVPRGKLIIAGDGPDRKELESFCSGLGLKSRVIFLPSYFDIPGLLAISNVMILPSKKEEFASVLLLGLISGLPLVAADFDGVDEFLKNNENGLIVRKQDSEDLAHAMRIIGEDTKLYQRMKENVQNSKREFLKYSLSAHAAKLLALAQEK